mmetsp:Transcript_38741/g.58924  ORF Transcript_38741/g.58924 Transcript_38741/m.58924 type:complete len:94 (+) Transcript_38741:1794-2075(+)
MKEIETANSEKNEALLRLTQEFKALDDQHRRKLVRYKDEYTHNIELVKDKLQEMNKRDVPSEKKLEEPPIAVNPEIKQVPQKEVISQPSPALP